MKKDTQEIIQTLKEIQMLKAVEEATMLHSLEDCGFPSNEPYTKQLAIHNIVNCDREPAIAFRFDRSGIMLQRFYSSTELLKIYRESIIKNGAVYFPVKNNVESKRIYFCLKIGSAYEIVYMADILSCEEGEPSKEKKDDNDKHNYPNNPNASLCIDSTVANQSSKYWIKITNIRRTPLMVKDLVSISSKRPLSYSFTGSQPIINCL